MNISLSIVKQYCTLLLAFSRIFFPLSAFHDCKINCQTDWARSRGHILYIYVSLLYDITQIWGLNNRGLPPESTH